MAGSIGARSEVTRVAMDSEKTAERLAELEATQRHIREAIAELRGHLKGELDSIVGNVNAAGSETAQLMQDIANLSSRLTPLEAYVEEERRKTAQWAHRVEKVALLVIGAGVSALVAWFVRK